MVHCRTKAPRWPPTNPIGATGMLPRAMSMMCACTEIPRLLLVGGARVGTITDSLSITRRASSPFMYVERAAGKWWQNNQQKSNSLDHPFIPFPLPTASGRAHVAGPVCLISRTRPSRFNLQSVEHSRSDDCCNNRDIIYILFI